MPVMFKESVSDLTVTHTSYISSARSLTANASPSPTAQSPLVSPTSPAHRKYDFVMPNVFPTLILSQGSQPVSDLSPLSTSIPKLESRPQPDGPTTAALFGSGTSLPSFTIGGLVIFPNSASEYLIGKQTLIPGSPAITVLGTPISLAQSASNIVIGGITSLFVNSATPLPPLTIDGTKILANSTSEYLISSQSLIPGSSTPASVNVSASATGPVAFKGAATTVRGRIWIVSIGIFGLGLL
ncbi:hypothetical protein MMC07_005755 [Pseudocyphellaria aurata]|nr:hypothetical protein [Pseudocyphellaria aurata]